MVGTQADFFNALYEFCESGSVNIRCLTGKEEDKESYFLPFHRLATAKFPKNKNVYFAVATRNGGGEKQHIVEIPALWADMDFKILPETESKKRLKECPLQPSAIIHSGGGYHDYWFLKEPCLKQDIEAVESLLRRFAIYLGADTSATDASRILRVPGTFNLKPEYGEPQEVKILFLEPKRRYDLSAFDSWLPADSKQKTGRGYRNPQGWQDEALKGVSEPGRHDTALKLAARWAKQGHSDSEIIHFLISWNERNDPPKPELSDPTSKEIQNILAYVREKNQQPTSDSCSIVQPGEFTDLGNATRFAQEHQGKIRYCHKFGKWFHWTGTRWGMDEAGEIYRTAKNHILQMLQKAGSIQDDKERAFYLKEIAKLQNTRKADAMLSMARHDERVFVLSESLDSDPFLFNCLTGTVDLKDFKYHTHNTKHLITKISPFTIADTPDCPLWKSHLKLVMAGKEDLIAFLQRALGSCLLGDNRDRKLFLLWGNGANGKSLTLEAIQVILGDYAMKTPAETLLVKRFESIPNDLAALNGARFVYTSEVADGKRLAESLVKEISGDRYIRARFMRGEWFSIPVTFKIFLATNHLPTIRGTDPAIWDRICLIPFNVRIPEGQRRAREELIEEFKAEGAGVLRWLLEGCHEWLHNGLNPPPEVSAANANYQQQMDILRPFLEDKCEEAPGMQAASADLYSEYEKWAKGNGEEPVSKTLFGKRLREKGFRDSRGTGGIRIWQGIGLVREIGRE